MCDESYDSSLVLKSRERGGGDKTFNMIRYTFDRICSGKRPFELSEDIFTQFVYIKVHIATIEKLCL